MLKLFKGLHTVAKYCIPKFMLTFIMIRAVKFWIKNFRTKFVVLIFFVNYLHCRKVHFFQVKLVFFKFIKLGSICHLLLLNLIPALFAKELVRFSYEHRVSLDEITRSVKDTTWYLHRKPEWLGLLIWRL